MSILEALASGTPIAAPVAVVVAHQDDETIGLAGRLAILQRLTLIHVTDGSPLDLGDARRSGFETRADYEAARWAELACAMTAAGPAGLRHVKLGLTDQTAVDNLITLADRLTVELAGQAAVITHPYEGGHPDHDACAFAVQAACAALGEAAPERLEFACYNIQEGAFGANRFCADPGNPEHVADLSPEDRARKAAAIACFKSQGRLGEVFPVGVERYRRAPVYDFTQVPPTGRAHYDGYGWPMTSPIWRDRARAALETLAGP